MNTLIRGETQAFIERCFMGSRQGFVFNLLLGPDAPRTYNRCRPEDMRAWTSHLEAEIAVANDYLPGDFTVALSRRR
jgi:hypothetical protein